MTVSKENGTQKYDDLKVYIYTHIRRGLYIHLEQFLCFFFLLSLSFSSSIMFLLDLLLLLLLLGTTNTHTLSKVYNYTHIHTYIHILLYIYSEPSRTSLETGHSFLTQMVLLFNL